MSSLVFPYIGSKVKRMRYLRGRFPAHKRYVVVFGGTGAEIICKPASSAEVYNDKDLQLYNLFKTIQEMDQREQVIERLTYTLYHPESLEEAKQLLGTTVDPVLLTWAFLVVRNLCWADTAARHANFKELSRSFFKHSRWVNIAANIRQIAERFRKVNCLNRDCLEVVSRYATRETLFSIDPPYNAPLAGGRSYPDLYRVMMTQAEHEELVRLCVSLEGTCHMMIWSAAAEPYLSSLRHWYCQPFTISTPSLNGYKDGQNGNGGTDFLWTNWKMF